MGMDQRILCDKDKTPSWSVLTQFLAARKFPIDLRMVDGELAFPDETPPETWRELRIGTPGGMITIRRESDGMTVVVWGNADLKMRQSWNAVAWALAHLTGGTVAGQSAEAFAAAAELPDGFLFKPST